MGERGPEHAYGAAAVAKMLHGEHFPITKQDLLSKHGNHDIEWRKGETLKMRDLLENVSQEEFNSPIDVEKAISENL